MELMVNFQKFSNPNQVISIQRTCQPKGNCKYIFDMCISRQLYDFGCTSGQRFQKSVSGGEEIDFSNSNPIWHLGEVESASVRSINLFIKL